MSRKESERSLSEDEPSAGRALPHLCHDESRLRFGLGGSATFEEWERCLQGQARVVTASNIPEAERLLDTVTPKTLIVDVRHLDGALELLEGLRAGGDGDRVPVVAVHGRLSKKARLRVDAVADTRLTFSELNQRSLRAALRELHDGERRTGLWAG